MVTGKSMCPIHPHFVSRFTLFVDSHSLVRYIIPLSVGPQRRLDIWKNLNVQFFQLMLSSPTVYQNPVNLTNFCQFCDFSKGSFGPLI